MTVETKKWWMDFWNQRQHGDFRDTPDEHVVRFSKRFFSSLEGKRVLEFGFGDGKDLLYFYSKGCTCYGIEGSAEICNSFLQRAGQLDSSRIKVGDYQTILEGMTTDSLDFIYAMEVLHYLDSKKNIADLLKSFYKVLRKDGKILFSFVHPQHFFMDNSFRIDKDCREFNKGLPYREGLKFVLFETAKEIKDVFSIFQGISIGSHDHSYDLQTRHVFWLVTAHK